MVRRSGSSIYPQELHDLMLLYGLYGIKELKRASPDVLIRASHCLNGKRIAENDEEVWTTLVTAISDHTAEKLKFIPMPPHAKHPRLERSFFLPLCKLDSQGSCVISFELFCLVSKENCLAFRFEPAHALSTHDYSHMQLCRDLIEKRIRTLTPEWIPDSYPAHPIYAREPISMFLSMLTALHGYGEGGVMSLVTELFQRDGRPERALIYGKKLREILVTRDSNHG